MLLKEFPVAPTIVLETTEIKLVYKVHRVTLFEKALANSIPIL